MEAFGFKFTKTALSFGGLTVALVFVLFVYISPIEFNGNLYNANQKINVDKDIRDAQYYRWLNVPNNRTQQHIVDKVTFSGNQLKLNNDANPFRVKSKAFNRNDAIKSKAMERLQRILYPSTIGSTLPDDFSETHEIAANRQLSKLILQNDDNQPNTTYPPYSSSTKEVLNPRVLSKLVIQQQEGTTYSYMSTTTSTKPLPDRVFSKLILQKDANARTYSDKAAQLDEKTITNQIVNREPFETNDLTSSTTYDYTDVSASTSAFSTNEPQNDNNEKVSQQPVIIVIPENLPKYISVFNWVKEPIIQRVFECVPMQTLTSFVRVCIHPADKDPWISSYLRTRGTWEFHAMRDVQLALLESPSSGLIDVGAGIGTFSLAAATLNHPVLAVEPFLPHLQVFHKSVVTNNLQNKIMLLRNVISDHHDLVAVEPKDGNINVINAIPLNERPTAELEGKSVSQSITLDDLADVCPFKTAVLKLDIPGYDRKALEHSDKLFSSVSITHVFLHWPAEDADLCSFYIDFFTKRGFEPHMELVGGRKLALETNETWSNTAVIWKKIK